MRALIEGLILSLSKDEARQQGGRRVRIGSYSYKGQATYGAFTPQGVVDLGARLGDRYPDLLALLQQGGLADAAEALDGALISGTGRAIAFLRLLSLKNDPMPELR